MEQQTATAYRWWENALKGDFGPVHDGHPQPGFYRRRIPNKDGGTSAARAWEGIAIWPQEGAGMVAVMGRTDKGELIPCGVNQAWTWAAKNPVTYAAYTQWKDTGRFPDDVPAPPAKGSVPGDNLGDEGSAFDKMRAEAEDYADRLKTYVVIDPKTQRITGSTIDTQDAANAAAVLAKKAGELATQADGEREDEKRPHLVACREVDDKWRDLITTFKDTAAAAKTAIAPFLRKQREAEDARVRAAQKVADDAAEAAAAALASETTEADHEVAVGLVEKAIAATKEAKPRKVVAGRTGAKVTMRKVNVAVFTDYPAALQYFANHADVQALILRLAQQVITANGTVPGVRADEQEKPV